MFLVLTLALENTKIRISVDKISSYYKINKEQTLVEVHNYRYYVKETPEEIDKLLNELYVTVKSRVNNNEL